MKRLKEKFLNVILKALTKEPDISKLVKAFCLGIYIAFCPFIGLHTVMVFGFAWLFRLNIAILFLGAAINNPWTMIPCYTSGYSFGYWLLHTILGFNSPWIISLEKVFGSGKICLLSFLIGGNILGLLIAIAGYPIVNRFFKKIAKISSKKTTPENM